MSPRGALPRRAERRRGCLEPARATLSEVSGAEQSLAACPRAPGQERAWGGVCAAETVPPARPSLQPLSRCCVLACRHLRGTEHHRDRTLCISWHRALRDPSPSTTSQGKDPKSVDQGFLPAWGLNSIICKILFVPLKIKIFLPAALCFYPFWPLLP